MPHTFSVGEVLTAATLNALGDWTAFTPTLVVGVTVTKTVTYARYARIGSDLVIANVFLTITGVGTASNRVEVGLPVTAATSALTVGSFTYGDTGTTSYSGTAVLLSTTAVVGQANNQGAYIGQLPAFTTANTDTVAYSIIYEAA